MARKRQVAEPVVEEVDEDEPDIVEEEITYPTEVSGVRRLDLGSMHSTVKKMMKLSTFVPETHYFLDTGFLHLNATMGSKKLGLPYGKIYELAGKPHGGKTTVTTILAGLAQQDGAAVIYGDAENSNDAKWARKLGLDLENTYLCVPKLVSEKKKPTESDWCLQSAEQIFEEVEIAMRAVRSQGFEKIFVMIDSIANLSPQMVLEAGTTGQNMRTNSARSMFLSSVLPKWAGLAANYNAMICLINQIRTKPGIAFGNPEYTPGGNALEHSCAVRVGIRRAKNGKMKQNGKTVGIVGIITNTKNKSGNGSIQDERCGFSIRWDKTPAKINFMSVEQAEDVFAENKE